MTSASAQSAQMEAETSPGSMVVLREVPTRPAQHDAAGEALTVTLAPNDAFADALDLGLAELDDAQAATITSSVMNGLSFLNQVDAGSAATDSLIADSLQQNGLSFLNGSGPTSAGSIVSGSVDASLAAANSAIGSALGSVSGALGGLNGTGQ
ncbi:hypothetical protein [Erythrobacter rubeus]|uniref:Uncharacterized protein n=1 Tax=Erythrobacter rubeus TaxID=2760803 RepID=A0ABR8KNB0_9SPHN|nr:hypothetical protein [Erythrobacter rubeus]MBD2842124.1 hypothetical protein [Erythrobacter rubeus]